MRINRAAIKQNAKMAILDGRYRPVLTALVYLLIVWLMQYLSTRLMNEELLYERLLNATEAGNSPLSIEDFYMAAAQTSPGAVAHILNFAMNIISIVLGVGLLDYMLQTSRRQPAGVGTLFDGFGIFWKALWINILIYIFVFLWSLLLFVPGIVALYRYRQAIYIMLDHPEYSALQCIRESKRMMRGRKGELFVLDLSFFGWVLLGIIPFAMVWVMPYTGITYANYYNALRVLDEEAGYAPGGWPAGQGPTA
jgi:hypothetical protein